MNTEPLKKFKRVTSREDSYGGEYLNIIVLKEFKPLVEGNTDEGRFFKSL